MLQIRFSFCRFIKQKHLQGSERSFGRQTRSKCATPLPNLFVVILAIFLKRNFYGIQFGDVFIWFNAFI